jgi:hypothetical protein
VVGLLDGLGIDHWVPVHAPDRLNHLLVEFLAG